MDVAIGLVGGFLLGIAASTIAWLVSERWAAPLPTLLVDSMRFRGQVGSNPPHEFFHVCVRNAAARWPVVTRRAAWACTARLSVLDEAGNRVFSDDIPARWTSQPEPLIPTSSGNLLDPAKVILGRRMDLHSHHEERLAVVVKFEGEADCFLFTNESYLYPRWQNPAWRLPPGTYRLRVAVLHEGGEQSAYFRPENSGSRLDDIKIAIWSSDASV